MATFKQACRLLLAALVVSVCVSCQNRATVTVHSVSGTQHENEFRFDVPGGAGTEPLGSIAYDIAAVEADLAAKQRLFLFTGDLRAGITVGDYLHFPMMQAQDPSRWYEIGPFGSQRCSSYRAYPVGRCSILYGYDRLASLMRGGLARAMQGVAYLDEVTASDLTVTIRSMSQGSGLNQAVDEATIHVTYRTNRVLATFWPNFECGAGEVVASAHVRFGGRSGWTGVVAEVLSSSATYRSDGYCAIEGNIASGLRGRVAEQLPESVNAAIATIGTIEEISADPCTRSPDCAGLFGLPENECRGGVCRANLGVDRFNFRPDGFEVVLVESEAEVSFNVWEERGGELFESACAIDRYSVPRGASAPQDGSFSMTDHD